jgi:hypothetical protein
MKVTTGRALTMHCDATPNTCLEIKLLKVIVADTIITTVEVYVTISQDGTVGIASV